jgi:hypothetical protein
MADETAMAYLNMARQYHDAANVLFAESDRRPIVLNHRALSSPLSLLYFHTLELGFKAFLRACGLAIEGTWRRRHDLLRLYKECRAKGLVVDRDDRVGIENIVNLLKSGNEGQSFRYFRSGSRVTADLAWTREVVDRFMAVVAREVGKRDPRANDPPRLAQLTMIVKVGPKEPTAIQSRDKRPTS